MRQTVKTNVTCPESAHLAEIECELDEGGRILKVLRCDAFDPPDAVTCAEECAARMNQRHALAKERCDPEDA